jgi:hypothetical protein
MIRPLITVIRLAIIWGVTLTTMNMLCVSKGKPEGEFTSEKEKEYSEADTIFCGVVVGVLVDSARYVPLLKNC